MIFTCPDCGAQREQRPSYLKFRQSDLCKSCAQTKRQQENSFLDNPQQQLLYPTWKKIVTQKKFDVDPEWRDFYKFRAWALDKGWTRELRIERVGGRRGFWPDNMCLVREMKAKPKRMSEIRRENACP